MQKYKIAVIGAGPAGCVFSCFCNQDVTLFEKDDILRTLLYTGGGRCNLAHAEFDLKELAKNYPRGEKFLYSVFSKFSTQDTLKFFETIGVQTYIQEDKRVFPKSDKATDVRNAIINKLKTKKVNLIHEQVLKIKNQENKFIINDKYKFDKVVIAIGGHFGFDLIKSLGHEIIRPVPSLVGLVTKEKFNLEGVSLINADVEVKIKRRKERIQGDLIFTKNGISGPLAYKISSLYARENYSMTNPINLYIDFKIPNLTDLLNKNGKKDLKNVFTEYMPKSVAEYIINQAQVENKKCYEITKSSKLALNTYLNSFPITVIGHENKGEIVTCGGVNLNEINSKTMESKLIKGLYFCGEVIDVDGFCGGFNLQNAWSTAFVAAMSMV